MKTKKNKKTPKGKALNGQSGNSDKTPRYLFLGLGVVGLGVAGYIGYRYWNSQKEKVQVQFSKADTTVKKNTSPKPSPRKWKDDSFPLSYNPITNTGSSGPKVLQLQQKLNQKFGAGLTADGKFGPLTKKALFANGLKGSVDMNTFNIIVDGEATIIFDPRKIANDLWVSSKANNFNSVILLLRQIKDVKDYQSVGTIFKTFRDASDLFRSHTLVTHLLDFTFKNSSIEKEQIKKEFRRIGLLENNGKWSLSGLGSSSKLITIKNTFVRDIDGNIVSVKKNTILGIEQNSTLGLTWFKAMDGTTGAVPSSDVKYTR